MKLKPLSSWIIALMLCIGCIVVAIIDGRPLVSWFFTPDQQAQHLFDKGDYAEAARLFSSPAGQGMAAYRAGDFKSAEQTFARINTAQGHFNHGNALVMQGKYDPAIAAYSRALEIDPTLDAAKDNLKIATLRAEATKQEGGEMTGGMLAADEIVFDTSKKEGGSDQTEESTQPTELSEQELQATWLRKVETRPADFLRAKFAFQAVAPAPTESKEAEQ